MYQTANLGYHVVSDAASVASTRAVGDGRHGVEFNVAQTAVVGSGAAMIGGGWVLYDRYGQSFYNGYMWLKSVHDTARNVIRSIPSAREITSAARAAGEIGIEAAGSAARTGANLAGSGARAVKGGIIATSDSASRGATQANRAVRGGIRGVASATASMQEPMLGGGAAQVEMESGFFDNTQPQFVENMRDSAMRLDPMDLAEPPPALVYGQEYLSQLRAPPPTPTSMIQSESGVPYLEDVSGNPFTAPLTGAELSETFGVEDVSGNPYLEIVEGPGNPLVPFANPLVPSASPEPIVQTGGRLNTALRVGGIAATGLTVGLAGWDSYNTESTYQNGLITEQQRNHREVTNYSGLAGGVLAGFGAAGLCTAEIIGAGPIGVAACGAGGGLLGSLFGSQVGGALVPGGWKPPPDWDLSNVNRYNRGRFERNATNYAYTWKHLMKVDDSKYLTDAQLDEAMEKYELAMYLTHGRDAPPPMDMNSVPENERYGGLPYGLTDYQAYISGRDMINQMAADGIQVYYVGTQGTGLPIENSGGLYEPDQYGLVYKNPGANQRLSMKQGRVIRKSQAMIDLEYLYGKGIDGELTPASNYESQVWSALDQKIGDQALVGNAWRGSDDVPVWGGIDPALMPYRVSAMSQMVSAGFNRDSDSHIDWEAIFLDGPQSWWPNQTREMYAQFERNSNILAVQDLEAKIRRVQERQSALSKNHSANESTYINSDEAHQQVKNLEDEKADAISVQAALNADNISNAAADAVQVQGHGLLHDNPHKGMPPDPTAWEHGLDGQMQQAINDAFPSTFEPVASHEQKPEQPQQQPSSSADKHPIFGDAYHKMALGVLPTDEPISAGRPQTETVDLHPDIRVIPPGDDWRGIGVWNPDFIEANTGYVHHDKRVKEDNVLVNALFGIGGGLLVDRFKS